MLRRGAFSKNCRTSLYTQQSNLEVFFLWYFYEEMVEKCAPHVVVCHCSSHHVGDE